MKQTIGKKIADIEEPNDKSPFFKILLEDGSLIHVAACFMNGESHQSVNLATGKDAELLGCNFSWENVLA